MDGPCQVDPRRAGLNIWFDDDQTAGVARDWYNDGGLGRGQRLSCGWWRVWGVCVCVCVVCGCDQRARRIHSAPAYPHHTHTRPRRSTTHPPTHTHTGAARSRASQPHAAVVVRPQPHRAPQSRRCRGGARWIRPGPGQRTTGRRGASTHHPHTPIQHGRSEVSCKPASRRGCGATSTSTRPAVPSLSGRGAVDPPRTGPRTTGRLRLRSHNNRGVRLACVRPRCARVCVGGWVVGEGAPPSRSPVVVGAQRGGSAAHWSKDSLRPCVCLWGWCVEAGAS